LGFDIIDVRQFDALAFARLLAAESHAWRESLRWDFTPSACVISNCLREKRLSGYALVSHGQVEGYCFFFYDGEKGLIGDLFVEHPEARTKEALRLLEHSTETLLGTPGLKRIEAQLPHFSFEELEPFFVSQQFVGFCRQFMARSLTDDLPATPPPTHVPSRSDGNHSVAKDFRILPWDRRHDQEAAELLYHAYHGHVDASINDQYACLAGATRLIDNIIQHQGCGEYLPNVSRVAVHEPSQRLAGILAVTDVGSHTAHIPQVAVGKDVQGRGLGTALMTGAFADLAARGYKEVSLTVTHANAPALRVYERLGFRTFRSFGAFVFNRS
jgi:ribosomal protein S18 acetylase RimI-like enzyme